ncbi:GGDEF domain-containing protein [Clostridia bacterium]|nr:GGDEF domain-containing protein [Clostridia bacterium]
MSLFQRFDKWVLSRAKGLNAERLRQLYMALLLILGAALVHVVLLSVRAAHGGVIWFDIGSLLIYVFAAFMFLSRRYALCIGVISWEIFIYAISTTIYIGGIAGLLFLLLCFQIQLNTLSHRVSQTLLIIFAPVAGTVLAYRHTLLMYEHEDPYILGLVSLSMFVSILLLFYAELKVERLLKQRRDAEIADLEQSAYRDPLTGLYNRRWLNEIVPLLARQNTPFSVAMLDIDHFKQVNDMYGHEVGDLVLQRFAELLSKTVRGGDTLFRYGGEEFVVLFESFPPPACVVALGRLSRALAEDEPLLDALERKPLMFSGGLTSVDWSDFDASLAQADKLLYKAKNTGRNKICT